MSSLERRARGALPLVAALLGLAVVVTEVRDIARTRSVPSAFGSTVARGDVAAAARQAVPATSPAANAASTSRASQSAPGPPIFAGVPELLTIPKLLVSASIVPVGVDRGILAVPPDPARIGWWSSSALAGSTTGSVVLDGHVDSAVAGAGALFRLTALTSGDRLVLTTSAGARHRYRVTGRRVYLKTGGLPTDLFTRDGPPRLVVITCGGPFDAAAGSYLDNVVVFAAPDDDAHP